MNLKTRCFITHILLFVSGLAFTKCLDQGLTHGQFMITVSLAITSLFIGVVMAIHGVESPGRQNVRIRRIPHKCDGKSTDSPAIPFEEEADPPACLADEVDTCEHENKKRCCKPKTPNTGVVIGKFPPASSAGFSMN